MNHVVLIGRTTKDAELRYIQGSGTPVARFTIAIDRDYKNKEGKKDTDFIMCEAMGKTAEFVANYITKGRQISVHGSLRVDSYMDAETRRTFTKVAVKNVNALDSMKKAPIEDVPQEFEAIDDDDIPF
nr:MAG: single-strand binding protein family protein [Bacteriophage sp.]